VLTTDYSGTPLLWTGKSVLIKEVSPFQGLICTDESATSHQRMVGRELCILADKFFADRHSNADDTTGRILATTIVGKIYTASRMEMTYPRIPQWPQARIKL